MSGARIAVIGAGRMGHGIAWRLAAAGHLVSLQDPETAALDVLPARLGEIREVLGAGEDVASRIEATSDLAAAVESADLVFEAAPENLALKQALFRELEVRTPTHAILCSNTSAIPIAQIAERLSQKNRVVGTHFWNPPYLVDLVEVVLMGEANRPAGEKVAALLRDAGAHPVFVNRDIPGFIGNRLQHALKREAIALVAAGICDAETIDDVVKHGFGARLGVLGPMEQSDLVGLDLTKAIHDVLIADLDRTPGTHPYLDDLVARGNLGMKTGKGFRTWTPEQAAAVGDRLRRFLVKAARSGL